MEMFSSQPSASLTLNSSLIKSRRWNSNSSLLRSITPNPLHQNQLNFCQEACLGSLVPETIWKTGYLVSIFILFNLVASFVFVFCESLAVKETSNSRPFFWNDVLRDGMLVRFSSSKVSYDPCSKQTNKIKRSHAFCISFFQLLVYNE